jgi:predicted enzyme related to lactoylglutathione lyase
MDKITTPANAAAWFEIGVTDLEKSAEFYSAVLGSQLQRQTMETQDVAVFPYEGGMSGNLFQTSELTGTGALAPVLHLNAPPPLEATLDRVREAGGKVVSEIVTIPPGRFAYCQDPDGTRFGLFTPD